MPVQSAHTRQLDPRDFPSWDTYQIARMRELTRARILNLRAANPHLPLARIADHAGVSVQRVKAVLGLPPTLPNY